MQIDPIFEVRHLQNEQEFDMLNAIYQNSFGESSVPTQTQKQWWTKANNNIFALFFQNKVVGGISFWSLTPTAFEKLTTGQLKERDITTQDFDLHTPNFYYISDIAIIEACRQKLCSNLLLKKFFEHIQKKTNPTIHIKITAFAFSDKGAKILIRLGFKKIKDAQHTPDHQDLYLLYIKNCEEMEEITQKLG